MSNMTVAAKIGETGKIITVILKDTNASTGVLEPKDLTGYTSIVMNVKKSDGTVIINAAACVADANQTTNTGKITCTTDITTGVHAGLVAGDFQLEFTGLNASGKRRYWPMNSDGRRTYGRFVVQASLQ